MIVKKIKHNTIYIIKLFIMKSKTITKCMCDKLDNFINDDIIEQKDVQTKITLKRNDGLIERVGNKKFITEDNRQLLND